MSSKSIASLPGKTAAEEVVLVHSMHRPESVHRSWPEESSASFSFLTGLLLMFVQFMRLSRAVSWLVKT